MIIDFHTHAFPKKISDSAIATLSSSCGNTAPQHTGTIESLVEKIKNCGCDKAVVLNIATNPKQQKNVNNYAISLLSNPDVIPFGSIHPDSDEAIDELHRLKEAGIKGIKLHPNYQNFFVDEERLFPIYEKAANLGLITVFHAGVDIGIPDPLYCTPQRLINILPIFKDTPVVAAHMGGYLLWKDVLNTLAGSKIYLDTSYSYSHLPPKWAKEIIKKHGADKILFGSDMPWSNTCDEIRFIESLGLSENETEQIFYKNAIDILKI